MSQNRRQEDQAVVEAVHSSVAFHSLAIAAVLDSVGLVAAASMMTDVVIVEDAEIDCKVGSGLG